MPTSINNRYQIIDKLGQGGMGTVYLVTDSLNDDHQLALKTIRADLLLERDFTQFKQEFAALGQLHHPNLVDVYDFGAIADRNEYFFTMEYVAGEDLPAFAKRYLGSTSADFSWLYSIIVQVCRVLHYIHARGFIHYDVKPSNIRLTLGGQVKLMDFGLVGEPRGDGQYRVRGTPDYIAPEFLRGESVDHRADLYSLGVALYEIITGQLPFETQSSKTIFRYHLHNDPTPPRLLFGNLPAALETLILRLLSKDPNDRYDNANAVIHAINLLTGLNYPVETKETTQGYIRSSRFIGRKFELARLQGLLLRMIQGQGRLVLVSGETGVGKSRLVRELRVQAQLQRVLVCEGICRRQLRWPYHGWITVLNQVISYQQATQPEVVAKYSQALVTLIPELSDLLEHEVDHLPSPREQTNFKHNLMSAVAEFLQSCERPLLFILEDLHNADNETLELFDYLGHHASSSRWMLCGLYRDDAERPNERLIELTKQARQLNLSQGAQRATRQITPPTEPAYDLMALQNFNQAETEQYLNSMLSSVSLPGDVVVQLMAETGGNPLFIESVMQSLVEEGLLLHNGQTWEIAHARLSQIPASIQDAVQRRLNYIVDSELAILQWAAVMGQWLDFPLLAELTDYSPDELFRVAAQMARRHILSVNNDLGQVSYQFSTDQMREAIYGTLTEQQRTDYHQHIGHLLIERQGGHQEIVEQLAWHFEQAGEWLLALRYAHQAGDKAKQMHANDTAVEHYSHALRLLRRHSELADPELEYQLRAGRELCYELLGQRQPQGDDLERMAGLAEMLGDIPRIVGVLIRQVKLAQNIGQYRQAQDYANQAMNYAWEFGASGLEADTLQALGSSSFLLGEVERAHLCFAKAFAIYKGIRNRSGEADCLRRLGEVSQAEKRLDKAKNYFSQALTVYREVGDEQGQAYVLHDLGHLVSNYAEQLQYHRQALQFMHNIGDRDGQARLHHDLGMIYHQLGMYEPAQEELNAGVRIERAIRGHYRLSQFLRTLGQVEIALGNMDFAETLLTEGQQLARDRAELGLIIEYKMLLGQVAMVKGDYQQAQVLLEQASQMYRAQDTPNQLAICLALWAAACLAVDDWPTAHRATSEAITLLDQSQPLLQHPPQIVWWWHYQVLLVVHGWREETPLPEDCWNYLQRAHDSVMSFIATLDDADLQRNYLRNVALNRDIVEEWIDQSEQLGPGDADPALSRGRQELARQNPDHYETVEDQLTRILEISVRMGEIDDLDELFDYIIDQVMHLSHAERGFLVLIDHAGQMDFRATRGVADDEQKLAHEKISYTVISSVAKSRSAILLEDALTDERFSRQRSVLDLSLRSVLCVPLISRTELLGLIYADSRTVSGYFSEADMNLMNIFATQAAVAVENKRLYIQSRELNRTLEQRVEKRTAELTRANTTLYERAEQLNLSGEIAQNVTSILNLDELLPYVTRAIKNSFDCYLVAVWEIRDDGQTLALTASSASVVNGLSLIDYRLPVDAVSALAEVFKRKEVQLIYCDQDPNTLGLEEVEEEIFIPLKIGAEVIGVLDIHSVQLGAFEKERINVLTLLANQTATALRNAQLYNSEQNRRQLAEALKLAGEALSSSLNLQEVQNRILAELAQVVPYEYGTVLVRQGDELLSSGHFGSSAAKMNVPERVHLQPGDMFWQISEYRKPMLLSDVTLEPGWQHLLGLPPNYSWIGVPLISKGEVMGMISLTRSEITPAFSQADEDLIVTFSAQAAIAIENASLYAEIEQRVFARTEELNQANLRLAQINRTKGDFIKVAAHELRTPLTVISGYTQLLKNNPVLKADEMLATVMEGILSGFDRLYEIVNSMLDVAKIDNQTLQMVIAETDLSVVISQARQKFDKALIERQIIFTTRGLLDLPLIQADRQLLDKVFTNLISNAIKYTPDGRSITVEGRHHADESAVEVVIIDTGIGIDAENIEVIFEKFFQLGETSLHSSGQTKFKGGGPGLGLPIVRGIVLAHKGRIWAESRGHNEEVYPGSQFHVWLPLDAGVRSERSG